MNDDTVSSERDDPRQPLQRLLGNYSEDHRNPTNQLIHWICVPLIVWTVMAALWTIPVPAALGRPGFWAGVAMFAACAWCLRLSRNLGLCLALTFIVMGTITEFAFRALGAVDLRWLALAVFVAAWIAQFVGHEIEGKRPSFLTDMVYLLVGPLWLASKLLRRLGIAV